MSQDTVLQTAATCYDYVLTMATAKGSENKKTLENFLGTWLMIILTDAQLAVMLILWVTVHSSVLL